jgi:beta-galactosidase
MVEEWSLNDICNHQVLHRNRLSERAYALPETRLLLNGQWQFLYSKSPVNAPLPSSQLSDGESLDDVPWTTIEVPGHWQLQGFGTPIYANTAEPFPFNPPFTTSDNPTGTYRKQFYVPDHWGNDYEFRLRFEGVDSAYHVFLNGKFLGYSQGSRNPAEFDASGLIDLNSVNELVINVYQWSDGSYLEDQDMWYLSGRFQARKHNISILQLTRNFS